MVLVCPKGMSDDDGCVDTQLFSLDGVLRCWDKVVTTHSTRNLSPNSYRCFRFSLTATISSLSIVRKVIPSMDDLEHSLTERNVKI